MEYTKEVATVKYIKFTYENDEYIVFDIPVGTTEVSPSNHCIGIKPVPLDIKEGSTIDSNGWYHVYQNMFHGYNEHITNNYVIEDMVEKYCFLSYNPYLNPDNYEPPANDEYYMLLLTDYYYGEYMTFDNPFVFKKTINKLNN